MSNYRDYPHIYYKKKYIGLQIQNVSRGNPDYLFTSEKGIDGCTKQLNNINAVAGNIHIMCNFICKTLGIKTSFYKDHPEDNSNESLLSQINEKAKSDFSPLETRIKSLEKQIENLEKKIISIDIETINKILEVVKKIDDKV